MSKNKKQRDYLANGSISMFCAEVAKLTDSHCLLKNIAISGIRADGTGYEGKEDHVNIIDSEDISALKTCKVHIGDKIYFGADVYEYKRKDGSEDFGVKNLREIERIEEYDLPTREELIAGQIWELVCEVCTFREKCDKMCCLANSEEMQKRFQILKDLQPGKFTAFTVVAAYEIWGKVITQMGGFKCPKDDPNYEIIKKIEKLSSENDSGVYWNLDEALFRLLHHEYRRIYFY